MSDQLPAQVIVRHLNGSKVNKVEQYSVADVDEFTFGRDVSSTISYDSRKDDIVSRKHAVIRVKSKDPLSFAISDLNSSNGTFVNGKRIATETEILPDDTVELGSGGPKFVFDVQPRPASLASRTRVMSTIETTATRVVSTASLSPAAATEKLTPPPKIGVGKDTVQMMLSEQHKKTSNKWTRAVAALVAFVVVTGGVIYWSSARDVDQIKRDAAEQLKRAEAREATLRAEAASNLALQSSNVQQQLGASAQEIATKNRNSVVTINVRWRLYDKETGRPVYHKVVLNNKKWVPAYVRVDDKTLVRWLTTDDGNNKNLEVAQEGAGSGFVVRENGFILTNKHVAAAWLTSYNLPDDNGVVYRIQKADSRQLAKPERISGKIEREVGGGLLDDWIPEIDGGMLFKGDLPIQTGGGTKFLFGKNERLDVRFPGNSLSIDATLSRAASRADAALLKIESPQQLTGVELQSDGAIKVGERVTVMGYPAISTNITATFLTTEAGRTRRHDEDIPEPTVTDGIISKLGLEMQQQGGTQIGSRLLGDAFQLSVVATGAGNSGGPVFNSAGKVIGLFTYGRRGRDGTRVTFAVPISHGLDLLKPQSSQ